MTNYYELIDAYLERSLPEEEMQAFEQEMQRDEDLRLTVEQYPNLVRAVEADAQEDLRSVIRQTRKELEAGDLSQVRPLWRRPWAAAAALLLLAVASTLIYSNARYSTPTLVQSAYVAPADLGRLQSGGSQARDWEDVVAVWQDGETTRALEMADAYLAQHGKDPEVTQRVAHMHFAAEDYPVALSLFEGLRQSTEYGDYADFHYALTLLQLGRKAEAMDVLDAVASDSDHRFSEQAAELRSDLSGLWNRLAFQ